MTDKENAKLLGELHDELYEIYVMVASEDKKQELEDKAISKFVDKGGELL